MTERILAVAAHPDDEILGVGGTLARYAAANVPVKTLILGEGATSRSTDPVDKACQFEVSALVHASNQAANVLGCLPPSHLGLPDNKLDTVPLLDIIKRIEFVIDEHKPTRVYTHHGGDLNIDHRITHEATVTACRPIPGSRIRGLYAFETLSSTEWRPASTAIPFSPNKFVGITMQLQRKIKALTCYGDEIADFPHARSIQAVTALAHLRGASVGLEAAEAFSVIREIEP